MHVADASSRVESPRLKVGWEPAPYGSSAPAVRDRVERLLPEISDEVIEAQKAGNRALMLSELQGILSRCDEGDPQDPRWDELRLRCLDRFAKLARIYESDAPRDRQGPGDPRLLRVQAARFLEDLAAKVAEG